MSSRQLERIFEEGTQVRLIPRDTYDIRRAMKPSNYIQCVDGFRVSVVAGWGMHCIPRPDMRAAVDESIELYEGPFGMVEVGFPTERPEPWAEWSQWAEDDSDPTETIYSYVPADAVRALIKLHGGERERHEYEPIARDAER